MILFLTVKWRASIMHCSIAGTVVGRRGVAEERPAHFIVAIRGTTDESLAARVLVEVEMWSCKMPTQNLETRRRC
jgi:hypothetical protein